MRRSFTFAALVVFSFLLTAISFAQNPASVQWTCAEPDSQRVSVISGGIEAFDETGGRNFGVYSYNPSLLGPLGLASQRWCPMDGTTRLSWGNQTEPNDSQYVQFALKTKAGFTQLHVDSISIYLGAGGTTDHIHARVVYALNTDFSSGVMISDSSFFPPRDLLAYYSFSINKDLTENDTLYVRVYTWYDGAASTSKYLYVQDVNIFGSAVSTTPASATWELSDPATGGTGQTITTSGPVNGSDESFMNMRINGYTGAENSQRTDNRTNGITQWPANQTTRIDSVFVQFTVLPRTGTKFNTKNISFEIGANSTNYLKAEVLWSLDSTFMKYGKIPDSLVLADSSTAYPGYLLRADTLQPVTYNIDTLINDEQTFYLRVYPWVDNQTTGLTGKYLLLKNVVMSGNVLGAVVYDLPQVTTTEAIDISAIFATSGGVISTDGGSPVTERGVCWNTTGTPTMSDFITSDGSGSGTFSSFMTGLTAGTPYYVRAYATNVAGTAYGNEITFTTLDSVGVPTLTTTSASNILVKTAQAGGNVTMWGGDTVTVRGVCWNTTGDPTVIDSKTENGSGLGSFTSILYPLIADTKYYFRAYATNSKGTGYGNLDSLTTQTPAPAITKVVSKDGSGDYTTVQAAFDAVPDNYTGPYTIFVKRGVYKEKLLLASSKVNVILKGEDRDSTILTYDDYANIAGGTSGSYSVGIDAPDFTAINITFQNTVKNDQTTNNQQAVALRSNGDRQAFYNCNLLGYQDTYYAWGGSGTGRVYMNHCYIEGSVDFIFGRDIVLFDSCEIHVNRNQCSITAASTEADSKFGLTFRDCVISYDSIGFDNNVISKIYLGRAWQSAPRTVFMHTYEPSVIDSLGWNQQPINSGVVPALYGVFEDLGPGFNPIGHGSGIGTILSSTEAADYTIANIFSKNSNSGFAYDWLPSEPNVTGIEDENFTTSIPSSFKLYQNYPNPFNPSTIIKYAVPKTSLVRIILFDVLGREVKTLVNEQKSPGTYQINLNASNLASGVYLYRIEASNFMTTKKMILLK